MLPRHEEGREGIPVVDSILKSVWLWRFVIGCRVCWGWQSSDGQGGHGHSGKNKDGSNHFWLLLL